LVEFKDVSVTYSSGVDALNKVNLKINDGDFAFVVGASGAGKSTLIKLVLKEIDATSGTVLVNGFNLRKLRRRKIPKLRRTIGVVFQDFRLIPTMTVYENVAFVLRVIDAPSKYIGAEFPMLSVWSDFRIRQRLILLSFQAVSSSVSHWREHSSMTLSLLSLTSLRVISTPPFPMR